MPHLRLSLPLLALALAVGCAGINHTIHPVDVLPPPPRATVLHFHSRPAPAADSLLVPAPDTLYLDDTVEEVDAPVNRSGKPAAPKSGHGTRTRARRTGRSTRKRPALPRTGADTVEADSIHTTVRTHTGVLSISNHGADTTMGLPEGVEIACAVVAPAPSILIVPHVDRGTPTTVMQTETMTRVPTSGTDPRAGSWFGVPDSAASRSAAPAPRMEHGAFTTVCGPVEMAAHTQAAADSVYRLQLHGAFPARFRPITEGSAIDVDSLVELERDSIGRVLLDWRPVAAYVDSFPYKRSWVAIFPYLRPGISLLSRTIVWPYPTRVLTRVGRLATMATEWIEIPRVPTNELRCIAYDAPLPPGVPPGLRLVGTVSPLYGGDAIITVHEEVRGGRSCDLSVVGRDRLAAYRYDIYTQLNRAATLDPNEFVLP